MIIMCAQKPFQHAQIQTYKGIWLHICCNSGLRSAFICLAMSYWSLFLHVPLRRQHALSTKQQSLVQSRLQLQPGWRSCVSLPAGRSVVSLWAAFHMQAQVCSWQCANPQRPRSGCLGLPCPPSLVPASPVGLLLPHCCVDVLDMMLGDQHVEGGSLTTLC